MPSKKLTAFRLDLEQLDGLEEVKRRTGAPLAEQVRRAIETWLASHGVTGTPDRKPKAKGGAKD